MCMEEEIREVALLNSAALARSCDFRQVLWVGESGSQHASELAGTCLYDQSANLLLL